MKVYDDKIKTAHAKRTPFLIFFIIQLCLVIIYKQIQLQINGVSPKNQSNQYNDLGL